MPLSPGDEAALDAIASRIGPDSSLLFITGAGLSADSGLPTYRGIGGLYEGGLDTPDGLPIEALLSGMLFEARPELTWKYLFQIIDASKGAAFNRGHEVIAALEGVCSEVWVLTQNVDGFHREAGSTNVIDIHGDLHRLICTRCDYAREVDAGHYGTLGLPPRCPECGAVVRPDVVLFGEALPMQKYDRFRERLARGFSAVFSVGTSSLFPYIEAPVYHARSVGTPTVEINPGRTDLSDDVDYKVAARAAEALDALWSRIQARRAP